MWYLHYKRQGKPCCTLWHWRTTGTNSKWSMLGLELVSLQNHQYIRQNRLSYMGWSNYWYLHWYVDQKFYYQHLFGHKSLLLQISMTSPTSIFPQKLTANILLGKVVYRPTKIVGKKSFFQTIVLQWIILCIIVTWLYTYGRTHICSIWNICTNWQTTLVRMEREWNRDYIHILQHQINLSHMCKYQLFLKL